MRLSHTPARTSATFDDPNLVSHGGLVPVMALAERAGLPGLLAERVRPGGECGANAPLKVIANIIVNQGAWNTTYQSLIPESIGNFAFNRGGMMEFPIVLALIAKRPDVLAVLIPIQIGRAPAPRTRTSQRLRGGLRHCAARRGAASRERPDHYRPRAGHLRA